MLRSDTAFSRENAVLRSDTAFSRENAVLRSDTAISHENAVLRSDTAFVARKCSAEVRHCVFARKCCAEVQHGVFAQHSICTDNTIFVARKCCEPTLGGAFPGCPDQIMVTQISVSITYFSILSHLLVNSRKRQVVKGFKFYKLNLTEYSNLNNTAVTIMDEIRNLTFIKTKNLFT